MSRGINKTISIGNLCADPETRYLPSGGAVTNIRLAMGESYKDKNTGQMVDKTEFMGVVFFGRLAEIAGEYLRKGSKVYIEGSLRTRKWTDKQSGQDRYTTEIVASEMQMLDGKGGESQGDPRQSGGYNQKPDPRQTGSQSYGSQRMQPSPPANQPQGVHQRQPHGGFDNSFDDDVPF